MIYYGSSNNPIYYGANEATIYYGSELIYPTTITGISFSPASITISKAGGSKTIRLASESNWEILVDTGATWITSISATGGTSGRSQITITCSENTGSTELTTTITARTTDLQYSTTCELRQKVVNYVSYIHKQNIETDMVSNIDTGIYPTTATTFRVVGMHKGFACDMVAGFWNGHDNKDYRLFWTNTPRIYFDWNRSRLEENHSSVVAESTIDFTGYNYGIKDSNGTVIITGTPLTHMEETGVTFKVNVGAWWLKKLQIWEGETLVFDGEAAIDDGHIGLYDSVSNQLKYNPDLTMGYEE